MSDSRLHISSDTGIEKPYYDYKITTPEAEQFEALHDSQHIFHDTHQRVNELLEPIQQDPNTLTLDNTTLPDENYTHETILILLALQLLQTPIFPKFLQHNLKRKPTIRKLLQYKMIPHL